MPIFGKEQPEPVQVAGNGLECLVCRNRTFYQRKAQLHGGLATLFNVEWASPTCVCVVCSECGFVHWFVP